jgi:phospholipid transport system substrate-binding protein
MKVNLVTIFLILLSSASMTVAATPYKPYYPGTHHGIQPQARAETPATMLKTGITKLTAFIKSGKAANKAQAISYLQKEIVPYFDFAYMTRWAAGPAWRHMNPAQRASMQAKLTEAFLTTLAQKLTTYTNQQIRYFTPRGRSGEETMVSAWIMQPNGPPTKLDFRFYKSSGGWKIFDVKAAGNSAVVYYRNQFRNMFPYPNQARYQR